MIALKRGRNEHDGGSASWWRSDDEEEKTVDGDEEYDSQPDVSDTVISEISCYS